MRGTMLWFNDTKDIGAIRADDGEHLSVHGVHFEPGAKPSGGRCGGTAVDYLLVEDQDGRRAEHVTLVPELVQRRARQRRSPRATR